SFANPGCFVVLQRCRFITTARGDSPVQNQFTEREVSMAVTLHDVATLAGVSIKTVSNVVNDYKHIRPTTREKVLAAIDTLGYQPNISARSLRSGKTGVIGLALPE